MLARSPQASGSVRVRAAAACAKPGTVHLARRNAQPVAPQATATAGTTTGTGHRLFFSIVSMARWCVCVRLGIKFFTRTPNADRQGRPQSRSAQAPAIGAASCRGTAPPTSHPRLVSPHMRLQHPPHRPANWCMGSCHHGRGPIGSRPRIVPPARVNAAPVGRHNRDRAPSLFRDCLNGQVVCVRPQPLRFFSRDHQTTVQQVQHDPIPLALA